MFMARFAPGYGIKLAASLTVAAAIVVPLAAVGTSVAHRHLELNRLASADPTQRERALNTLIRYADDPRWINGAARRLDALPDDAVLPLVNALRFAEVEDADAFYTALAVEMPRLSDGVFAAVTPLFLEAHAAGKPGVVAQAIVRLRSAPDWPSRQAWIAWLDEQQAWTTPPVPIDLYVDWLARGTAAERPALRIDTARRLGDLPIHQPAIDAQDVAAPLRQLLGDDDAAVRAAALWAIAGYVPRHAKFLMDIEQAATDEDPQVRSQAQRLTREWSQADAELPQALGPPAKLTAEASNPWSSVLMAFDNQPSASIDVIFDAAMPHHVRIAATRAARHAEPRWLLDTLRINDRPALRDVAALTLAQRFTPDELATFITELLKDHDPEARLSGAVLSGLIGRGAGNVETALLRERRAADRIVLQAALWMQGHRPALDGQVQAFLGNRGVPQSTLLLAMLHAGQTRAVLDRLLGLGEHHPLDLTGPPRRTTALLRTERWTLVLNRYLPPDAPRLPLHATDPVFAQRLADLRAWHALHRFE